MSDLDYDAHLTDDEREALGAVLWELDYDSDPRPDVFAAVERILQTRLLDLAQRAEADRAAVERALLLAHEWMNDEGRTWISSLGCDLRAALDRKADQ